MDHLPYPQNPTHSPLDILYVCETEYDGGTDYSSEAFRTYPKRAGWHDFLYHLWDNPNTADELNPRVIGFLQTWLFFGLLSSVIQSKVKVEDFTRTANPSGPRFLSCRALPGLIRTWKHQIEALQPSRRGQWQIDAYECLKHVRETNILARWKFFDEAKGKVLLSIHLLYHYLYVVVERAHGHPGDKHKNFQFSPGPVGHGGEILRTRMLKDGWCLNEV
ncbi:MAG: hypothetical protein M1835_007060 [Candelina submexicana]|nr:MAG: hypothetical protein M1835_007060 [Candelina submexicana]